MTTGFSWPPALVSVQIEVYPAILRVHRDTSCPKRVPSASAGAIGPWAAAGPCCLFGSAHRRSQQSNSFDLFSDGSS